MMEDINILLSVAMIITAVLISMFRLTQNPRAKQKDNHYSQLIKIKDDTIADSLKTIKSLRSRIQRIERGPNITENDEAGEGLEDLIDLYDNAPGWIKQIVSKDDIRKMLKDDTGKLKNTVEKFKNRKSNKEADITNIGL